ncbi:uncharacterized protein SPPG_05307 [Spizellomyces punctatus DAOM BR117]|uniref:Ribosomal protein S11 n=1 Tax=Spizellomyces punctatus (strain DAOM BR117) TaxID=645134 RepID=A0A0L0HEP8_SPIPD|nr:uncharacterized protein SPPG_05307 [Spizellomyces punctatus DAOM BR117]KNC99935.1 hypothetical protein SPPG_05307 [Spizellomyces punctatus DAOM BR117]|eukprot:XP_016607975.1 hypothetical protein SPPG_05307 [Spizellomyces punctatus DAOM BR117]
MSSLRRLCLAAKQRPPALGRSVPNGTTVAWKSGACSRTFGTKGGFWDTKASPLGDSNGGESMTPLGSQLFDLLRTSTPKSKKAMEVDAEWKDFPKGRRENFGRASLISTASDMYIRPNFDNHYIVHVTANRNNTVCVLTNPEGNVLTWSSAGRLKLRKAARGTPDAGYQSVIHLTELASNLPAEKKASDKPKVYHGVNIQTEVMEKGIHLKLQGFGPGRDQAFRAILAAGWRITRVTDVTKVRHAGCRPPKRRRL